MNKKQQRAKKVLTVDFFMEGVKKELALEYSRQRSRLIKMGIARKRLSTS